MKLRLKVTQVSSRLQSIFAGEAICTSSLELVSMQKGVGKPQTSLLWLWIVCLGTATVICGFRAFLKCMNLWIKLALAREEKKREGHLD